MEKKLLVNAKADWAVEDSPGPRIFCSKPFLFITAWFSEFSHLIGILTFAPLDALDLHQEVWFYDAFCRFITPILQADSAA